MFPSRMPSMVVTILNLTLPDSVTCPPFVRPVSLMQVIWKPQSFPMSLKLTGRRVWLVWTLITLSLTIVRVPLEAMSVSLNRRGMPEWAWCPGSSGPPLHHHHLASDFSHVSMWWIVMLLLSVIPPLLKVFVAQSSNVHGEPSHSYPHPFCADNSTTFVQHADSKMAFQSRFLIKPNLLSDASPPSIHSIVPTPSTLYATLGPPPSPPP